MPCYQTTCARRRSVAASICHTIKAFCKRLLDLLYACLLYNRQDCCHSPGIAWACLLCNQQRCATIQPADQAGVTGSLQQDRTAQRPRPPDCMQFPAICRLYGFRCGGAFPIKGMFVARLRGHFKRFCCVSFHAPAASRGRLCRACKAAVIRRPLKNPARNVEFLAKIVIK